MRRCLVTLALLLALSVAPARADWTSYHADAQRTGVDQTSGTPLPFASAWTSPNLGASIYAEPLVYHGLVIVVTEQNDVYALNEATGQVVWQANPGRTAGFGTPSDPGGAVPSNQLPCGDITPWVGITSTPVIDPATGTLFVVADLWDGSHAHHTLVAYNVFTGVQLGSKGVDQPGSTPENQLQRAALNLSAGRVLIGFGANAGDCVRPGTGYWGWLVSVSEDGSSMSAWKAPTGRGDSIWAAAGPTVDGAGAVYAVTGNGSASGTPYDYSDAVVKFDSSANPVPSSYFAPSNWVTLNAQDLDLGSSGTVLLPDNLAFQDGKDGNGWLLSTANLGGIGGQLYTASTGCASFGGDAYVNGIIYVACASGGTQALSLDLANPSSPSFSARWRGPSDANGSPIVAGGRVWVTSYTANRLYGLDPGTGAVDVLQSTPAMEHFTTPAASDGQLVLATGSTVEAYTIATRAHTLSVTRSGPGSGTVRGNASPAIACPATCFASYPSGTTVTLTETPGPASTFGGWTGGGCSGSANTCTVTLGADVAVTAIFNSTASVKKRVGDPTVSRSSLSGVARRKPRLAFTVTEGSRARALKAITIRLPAGLRFVRTGLAKGLTVSGPHGGHLRFSTKLRHGVLTIALKRRQRSVRVVLHGHAISATKQLARQVAHDRRTTLRVGVKVFDAHRKTTRLTLKLRV